MPRDLVPRSTSKSVTVAATVAVIVAVALLPLIGAIGSGREPARFFRFPPPLELPAGYVPFRWTYAAGVLVVAAVTLIGPWIVALGRRRPNRIPRTRTKAIPTAFPRWGWAAVVGWLGWWVLAWSRFAWFATFQQYTFFPLWLGFIVTVNACVEHRTGTCLMRRAPARWFGLFGASALCWWGFEWLNRFVGNWHYLNAQDFGPAAYAVHASICFSTVLPAVAAVAEWIGTHESWLDVVTQGPRWTWLQRKSFAAVLMIAAVVALVGTGAWPTVCYPALWLAPLGLFLGASVLVGRGQLAREMARGDWHRAATWMVAALICGGFWEMWNYGSTPKWIYTVPGAERWKVFEMPLLGYLGYLPFGLECLLASERILSTDFESRPENDQMEKGRVSGHHGPKPGAA